MNLDKVSRIMVWLYGAVAVLNVVSFMYWGHDINKISVALLLVTLIVGQKSLDRWREAAKLWREIAEGWRRQAEENRRWHG